jgi:hypothetical protein|nr:MAG TPA: hypothetical protein [Caudoviricetes sp.]
MIDENVLISAIRYKIIETIENMSKGAGNGG